jgi:signal transduction histidine kinase/DNA-binding NarL/FixJ family response regulator/HPt (histidine-containing phosphotransfer) domain-containing protein
MRMGQNVHRRRYFHLVRIAVFATVMAAMMCAFFPARAQQAAPASPPQQTQQQQPAAVPWGNLSPFLTLNDKDSAYDISSFAYVTPDPQRQYSYKDIYERHTSGARGVPARGGLIPLGAAAVPYWIVFSVENQSWDDRWVMSFGQHMDGRFGTLKQVFLYEHFSRSKYFDNITPQQNNFVSRVTEINAATPVTIERGKKALFVMLVEPASGSAATLVPRIVSVHEYEQSQRGLHSKTNIMGFFCLLMAGIFAGVCIFQRYFSASLLSLYFILQMAMLYYLNDTLYTDFPLSMQVTGGLGAVAALCALFATKILLHVGDIQRAQGRGITVFIIGLLIAGCLGSFLIPEQSARPFVMYSAIALSFFLLILLSLAQAMRGYKGAYRFALVWALALGGLVLSMMTATGLLPATGGLAAVYWYSLIPQGLLMVSILAGIITFEGRESQSQAAEAVQERERLTYFRQSKEATEIARLRKLIDHERQVMNELRDREAQQSEEMRKAKELADEANRAKSAFLAVISHEIRTPMTGIMGMIRLLQETTLSNSQREYAQTIQDSGDAMVSLLNDILDFEKIESGKMDLEHLDFDLHRLLNGVVTLMSGHAAAKGIALKLELDADTPRFVVGDPVRLRQVLLNLVGNAIKFTSEGSVTLQARPNQKGAHEGMSVHKLYFGVKDTGIGISKEAQQNLFNPFAQADNSITRKFGGTGLGLAISQRLIEAMGGRIQIDSTEGRGSTFYFIITMEEGNAGSAAQQQSSATTGGTQKSARALRIMIVEDNEINQRLLREFVDRMGHHVTLAGSGEEALKIIGEQSFDLVLMDIELPGMSGMGTTKAIRALGDERKAALPVIALSGNVRDEDIRACYAANMNGHLSKPVDPKRLSQMIDKVINGALDNPVVVHREGRTDEITPVEAAQPFKTSVPPAAEREAILPPGNERAPFMTLTLEEEAGGVADEDSFSAAINTPEPVFVNQAAATAVFDPTPLRDLRRDMPEAPFQGMMEALLDKMTELVSVLKDHPLNGEMPVLSARAHELKGMSGNYGLKEISLIAAQIEKDAREQRTGELPMLIQSLPDAETRARHAIGEWMEQKNF